jgi:hypothetical protein
LKANGSIEKSARKRVYRKSIGKTQVTKDLKFTQLTAIQRNNNNNNSTAFNE